MQRALFFALPTIAISLALLPAQQSTAPRLTAGLVRGLEIRNVTGTFSSGRIRRRRLLRSLPGAAAGRPAEPVLPRQPASNPLRGGRRPCDRGPRAAIRAAAPASPIRCPAPN
ncbi:MAG: hypothetical protein ACLQU1_43105 [Bryobacteraceae bacterium]